MKKRNIIIGAVVLVIVIVASYFIFFRKQNQKYSLAKVAKGNVVQEVTESGTVKVGDEIDISFKSQGKIDKIYVKVGDTVKTGSPLVKIDAIGLSLQLTEAEANLSVAQAKLNKLVAGATNEEIKVSEAEVLSKEDCSRYSQRKFKPGL